MPREDETYRNASGGHVRTCTCVDCTNRRVRPRRAPRPAPPVDTDYRPLRVDGAALWAELEQLGREETVDEAADRLPEQTP